MIKGLMKKFLTKDANDITKDTLMLSQHIDFTSHT
jgi:hypothetical protein